MPDFVVPQIGVGMFHALLFHDRAGGRVPEMFVSKDERHACSRSVIVGHGWRVSQKHRFESCRGEWALFSVIPSALSFVFFRHTLFLGRSLFYIEFFSSVVHELEFFSFSFQDV